MHMRTPMYPKDCLEYKVQTESMVRRVIHTIRDLLQEAHLVVMQLWLLRKLPPLAFAPIPLDLSEYPLPFAASMASNPLVAKDCQLKEE